jgi:hypothetical protein
MAKKPKKDNEVVPYQPPKSARIVDIRDQRVMLDKDVAEVFGVETRALNQQVTRNAEKFGGDFAFRITLEELDDLRSQNVISSGEWGGVRYAPFAFTEHGVVMAATLLKTPRAIQATRFVVQTFVLARQQMYEAAQDGTSKQRGQFSFPLEFRNQVMTKVSIAIGHVLDAMINPDEVKKAREEAKGVLVDSMKALKAVINKPGLDNEHKVAEIRKLMAEAENIEVDTDGKRLRNEEQQLQLLAKKLSLVMQAQHFALTGNADDFIRVLNDLGEPPKMLKDKRNR